jgi:CheY-like chemotaxis protein
MNDGSKRKFSILVVDDEKEICISLSEIIRSNGYRTLYTVDPAQVPAKVYVQYLTKGIIILTVVGLDSYSRYKR